MITGRNTFGTHESPPSRTRTRVLRVQNGGSFISNEAQRVVCNAVRVGFYRCVRVDAPLSSAGLAESSRRKCSGSQRPAPCLIDRYHMKSRGSAKTTNRFAIDYRVRALNHFCFSAGFTIIESVAARALIEIRDQSSGVLQCHTRTGSCYRDCEDSRSRPSS